MKKFLFTNLLILISLTFVCACNNKPQTLEDIKAFYGDAIINHAKNIEANNGLVGNYELVILDKENTIEKIRYYTFDPAFDDSEVERGLFVKYDAKIEGENDILFTAYYNYGLELNTSHSKINVSYISEYYSDSWELVAMDNKQLILFEYAIIN